MAEQPERKNVGELNKDRNVAGEREGQNKELGQDIGTPTGQAGQKGGPQTGQQQGQVGQQNRPQGQTGPQGTYAARPGQMGQGTQGTPGTRTQQGDAAKDFNCEACGSTFNSEQALTSHNEAQHNE